MTMQHYLLHIIYKPKLCYFNQISFQVDRTSALEKMLDLFHRDASLLDILYPGFAL